MQKIFKFPLPLIGLQVIPLAIGAEILCVQQQANRPFLWALVDPQARHMDLMFGVFQTGQEIAEIPGTTKEYIGTIQLNQGSYVMHVFQFKEAPLSQM